MYLVSVLVLIVFIPGTEVHTRIELPGKDLVACEVIARGLEKKLREAGGRGIWECLLYLRAPAVARIRL